MTNRIRVRVLRTHWAHWGRYSGINRYFAYLDARRYAVDDRPVPNGDQGFPLPHRAMHWIRARIQDGTPWYHVRDLVAEVRSGLRCSLGDVDVLHYLDPEHGLQFYPLVAHRLPRRARLVATFHQPLRLLSQIVRRDVVRRLDHAIVVAPEQLPFLAECLPEDRISVVLHGIDTDFYHPPPSRQGRETFTCVTVGHHLRDFAAVRAVAERLRDDRSVRFRIVAAAPTGLEDLPNTTVMSGLSDDAFRSLYQDADVLLLPLTDATANNALLEGLACGLPVVTTDLEAVRSYAPGEEAIRVPGNDHDQLTEAVVALRDSPSLRTCMEAAARRRAEALSWRVIAPQYDHVYRTVVAEARAPRQNRSAASAALRHGS